MKLLIERVSEKDDKENRRARCLCTRSSVFGLVHNLMCNNHSRRFTLSNCSSTRRQRAIIFQDGVRSAHKSDILPSSHNRFECVW